MGILELEGLLGILLKDVFVEEREGNEDDDIDENPDDEEDDAPP